MADISFSLLKRVRAMAGSSPPLCTHNIAESLGAPFQSTCALHLWDISQQEPDIALETAPQRLLPLGATLPNAQIESVVIEPPSSTSLQMKYAPDRPLAALSPVNKVEQTTLPNIRTVEFPKLAAASATAFGIRRYSAASRPVRFKFSVKKRAPKPVNLMRPIRKCAKSRPFQDEHAQSVAMTRRKLPGGEAMYYREKKGLAFASATLEEDLRWIGVFPFIPLIAARGIEVDEHRGILSIALKPEAFGRSRVKAIKNMRLAMGRNRKTGAIVQTVIP